MTVSENAGDGADRRGRDLEISIRIGTDGQVYFNDLTVDLLPVAAALAPADPRLAPCIAAARTIEETPPA
jgi:hypothetical protein